MSVASLSRTTMTRGSSTRSSDVAGSIEDLYFAANPKVVGSGRHRLDGAKTAAFVDDVRELVTRLRPLAIKANVLVNPGCLGDGYTDPQPILRHLAELQEVGVAMVTLTDLNLATLVRRHLPSSRYPPRRRR